MEEVKIMIHDQDLPIHPWDEEPRTTVYVQNIVSHSSLGFKTPKEMYIGNKCEVRHLKIFSCPVYVHILEEKRTKLDHYGKKGIFVGYYEISKTFRIYISTFHHIEISMDVTFDEVTYLKKYRRCQLEEVHEEDVPPIMVEVVHPF